MKFVRIFFVFLIVLGFLFPVAAAPKRSALPHRTAPVSPRGGYERLWNWAKAHTFQLTTAQRGKAMEMANRWGNRLVFTDQSRGVEINGVTVMMSFPFLINDNVGWISSLDLETVIRPVLYPAKNGRGEKVKTIVLDPGHGGKDAGTRNGSSEEKKYTLLLAQELRDQLSDAGFSVSLTRTSDTYVDLGPRTDLANRRHADLFISLHFNAIESGRDRVSGSQVYCFTPVGASSTNARGKGTENTASPGNRHDSQNVQLAYQIQKSLTRTLQAEDRGVCHARFDVLRDAQMPAVLVEGGFLSHPAEGKKIIDPTYRKQMAQAIVRGVQAYKDLVEE